SGFVRPARCTSSWVHSVGQPCNSVENPAICVLTTEALSLFEQAARSLGGCRWVLREQELPAKRLRRGWGLRLDPVACQSAPSPAVELEFPRHADLHAAYASVWARLKSASASMAGSCAAHNLQRRTSAADAERRHDGHVVDMPSQCRLR